MGTMVWALRIAAIVMRLTGLDVMMMMMMMARAMRMLLMLVMVGREKVALLLLMVMRRTVGSAVSDMSFMSIQGVVCSSSTTNTTSAVVTADTTNTARTVMVFVRRGGGQGRLQSAHRWPRAGGTGALLPHGQRHCWQGCSTVIIPNLIVCTENPRHFEIHMEYSGDGLKKKKVKIQKVDFQN